MWLPLPPKTILERLANLVAPPRCLGCLQENTWLCRACRLNIRYPQPTCPHCHRPSPRGLTCRLCRRTSHLTGAVSAGSYTNPLLQRGVSWLKFKGVRAVAPVLAELLLPRLLAIAPYADLTEHAVLTPIPLHRRRQRQRGFNQSEEIAAALARYLPIPIAPLLIRSRATWTQSHLPTELRATNVQNIFTTTQAPPIGKTILLIDDVTTSGSTLNAAAAAIHTAGTTSQIWGCTIAHG